jgi:predicted DNA-binding protein with PD1-like motif
MMRSLALAAAMAIILASGAWAQEGAPVPEYVTKADIAAGSAPGMKATELSPKTRSFHIVFSKGDDVEAGLAQFAAKNHLTDAHFSAIGAFGSAVIGWSDRAKKAFKAIRLNEEMEVASLTGSITRGRDGKPQVHIHCVVALLRNGQVYAGHLLEGHVSLTMQMYLTDSEPLSGRGASER